MNPICALRLPPDLPGRYMNPVNGQPLKELTSLSRVNIFVGANNSGKSRLLRHLAKAKSFSAQSIPKKRETYLYDLQRQIDQAKNHFDATGLIEFAGMKAADLGVRLEPYQDLGSDLFDRARDLFDKFADAQHTSPALAHNSVSNPIGMGGRSPDLRPLASTLNRIARECSEWVKELPPKTAIPRKVYIPVLRGLRPLKASDDLFEERTKGDYFRELNNATMPRLFTGASLYENVKDLLLGLNSDRAVIRSYQKFLSSCFFEDQEVTLVARSKHDVLYVKIGSEHDRAIYELGDGIQQAIILTFLPFTTQEPTFFFIEEPEVHMHPGLQRKLLDFLTRHEACMRHHFFLTTHSNHLLDMTADFDQIAVLNFRKRLSDGEEEEREAEFFVEPVDVGTHAH